MFSVNVSEQQNDHKQLSSFNRKNCIISPMNMDTFKVRESPSVSNKFDIIDRCFPFSHMRLIIPERRVRHDELHHLNVT